MRIEYITQTHQNQYQFSPEIGGHAYPRFVRVMSVSAIFLKSYVRVRVREHDLEISNVHVRVRVRDVKSFHDRVRGNKMPLLVCLSKLDGLKVDVP